MTIRASDHEASERLVLAALGVEETSSDEWFDFSVAHYGALVLDPDGNNVEVVSHNRD